VSLTVASPPPPATATPDCCSGGGSTEAARADRAPRAGLAARLAGGLHYGLVQMFEDLGRYMLIGFLLAGLLAVVLEQWQPLGDALHSPWAPFVMLVVGVPVYVCAASMTPMVAVLISQGLSPGAGLVFLLVGPATNAASLVLLKQILGLRAVVIYLASIVVCALLAGYAVDGLYGLLALQPRTAVSLHHHGHEHMGWLNTAAALVLALLVVNGIARRYAKRWWGGASPSQPEVELSGRGAPGRA
ncbi:MAG: permease, partial [Phycisphaerae bacterium]|nr:permease [Phycisphaerae bacterium]